MSGIIKSITAQASPNLFNNNQNRAGGKPRKQEVLSSNTSTAKQTKTTKTPNKQKTRRIQRVKDYHLSYS
jgi:hypothetical protein